MNRPYVYFDYGFYGPCNLKCTYCRSEIVHDDGSLSIDHVERIIDIFCARHSAAVAKTSGYGEVTMWPHFPALLSLLERFPVVQIITNGTFGPVVLDALLRAPRLSPNLTIDGHTLLLNSNRVGGHRGIHDRIMDNLRLLVEGGKKVEINCVLHDRNIEGLSSFCEYLSERYGERVMLFPFPARSFSLAPGVGSSLAASLARHADKMQEIAETYSCVLPPPPYIHDLAAFLRQGGRRSACHVHWLNAGSGPTNQRLHCANYGEDLAYGSMSSTESALAQFVEASEKLHLLAGRVGPKCNDCFNHFHVLGMFLENRMTLEDLCRVPSLSFPGVREIVEEVQALFVNETSGHSAHMPIVVADENDIR